MKLIFLTLFFVLFTGGESKTELVGKAVAQASPEEIKEFIEETVESVGQGEGEFTDKTSINSSSQNQIVSQDTLWQIASEMNASVPIMIDKETMLFNVVAEENALSYNFLLVNYLSSEIDPDVFANKMKPVIVNRVCSHPDTQIFWENGISLHYYYSGNDHIFVKKLTVTPSECGY